MNHYIAQTVFNQDDIMHFGVKGMRWGTHRALKKEYGMSPRQVKKAIRKAKRAYRKSSGEPLYFDGTTGKNWASVRRMANKQLTSDRLVKRYEAQSEKYHRLAEKAYKSKNRPLAEKYMKMTDSYVRKSHTRTNDLRNKHEKSLHDALLKDIGYTNITKGRRMLKDYNIRNSHGMRFVYPER